MLRSHRLPPLQGVWEASAAGQPGLSGWLYHHSIIAFARILHHNFLPERHKIGFPALEGGRSDGNIDLEQASCSPSGSTTTSSCWEVASVASSSYETHPLRISAAAPAVSLGAEDACQAIVVHQKPSIRGTQVSGQRFPNSSSPILNPLWTQFQRFYAFRPRTNQRPYAREDGPPRPPPLRRSQQVQTSKLEVPTEKQYVPSVRDLKRVFVPKEIVVPDGVTVRQLAGLLSEKQDVILSTLSALGDGDLKPFDSVPLDSAELVALELGKVIKRGKRAWEDARGSAKKGAAASSWPKRPPIITVMGHVDHGKTSLLDALRSTSVAAGEAGGITQHLGAFVVRMPGGAELTFLDTPGHAAFSAMRSRGAAVTDIVILVVAADDGVMPQTREALAHAREAKVAIVVAINKCDKPGADPARVRRQLLEEGLELEEVGGDVQVVEVSATARQGLQSLEEALLLQADLMDLRADVTREAEAVVLEARQDKGQGPLASVLVKCGQLAPGTHLVVGQLWGKVRALRDPSGRLVTSAGPAQPVEVLGLKGLPETGDEVLAVATEERARRIAEGRAAQAEARRRESTVMDMREKLLEQARLRSATAAAVGRTTRVFSEVNMPTLQSLLDAAAGEGAGAGAGERWELAVVVKADMQGTAQAVTDALLALSGPQIGLSVVHAGVGPVSLSDVETAAACLKSRRCTRAAVVGFNVKAGAPVEALAAAKGVPLHQHRVIYHLLEDVGTAMVNLAPGTKESRAAGQAEVLQIFGVKKKGVPEKTAIAGCRVTDGSLRRGASVRILRSGRCVYEGRLDSLKREKNDVERVDKGKECGLTLDFRDWVVGDTVECLEDVMRRPKLVSDKSGKLTLQA